ncbi:hypothetical protein BGX26_003134 [Mortierella sp. AD094]|nr:hypothetical protein BGX26_003134 [Mortierella sp. AD094]
MKRHHTITEDNPMETRNNIVHETQMVGPSSNQQSDCTMLTLSTSANNNDKNIDPHGQVWVPDSCPPALSLPDMNESSIGEQRCEEYDLSLVGSVMQDPFEDGEEEHQQSTMAAVDVIEGFRDGGALFDPSATSFPSNNSCSNENYTTSMSRTSNEDASMDANAEKDDAAKTSASSATSNELPPASQPETSAMENAVSEDPLQGYTPFDADSWSNTIAEHKARTVQNFHLITQSLDSINAELQYIFCEFLTQQYSQIEETLKSGHESILLQEKAQERMQDQIMSFVDAVKSAFQILDGSEYN